MTATAAPKIFQLPLTKRQEGHRIVSLKEAARLRGVSVDTLKRNHADKIIRLSQRRVGMRVRDALALDEGAGDVDAAWRKKAAHSLTIDGELWAAVEWSEKRQRWCMEDAEGRCLKHLSCIHGDAPDRDAASAKAEAMIRDGRMPDPETARKNLAEGQETPSREAGAAAGANPQARA